MPRPRAITGEKRAIAPVRRWSPCANPPGRTTASGCPEIGLGVPHEAAPPSRGRRRRRGRSRARSTCRERPTTATCGRRAMSVIAQRRPRRPPRRRDSSQVAVLHHRVGQQAAAHLRDRRLGRSSIVGRRTRSAAASRCAPSETPSRTRASGGRRRSSGPRDRRCRPQRDVDLRRPAQSSAPAGAGEALVRGDVAIAGAGDHLVGQRRRRRLLVPAGGGDEVAHELLVEARRARPGA